jgi:hypothetical protein
MNSISISLLLAIVALAPVSGNSRAHADAPYKIIKSARVGGDGGFDYVYADSAGRKLYVPRNGPTARVSAFDLDTLVPVGEIPKTAAHGAAVDSKYHHAFCSSGPVVMWDTKTLQVIKTINVEGRPDGILEDPYNHRVYILSHSQPNLTVIDAKDGVVLGTIDIGGAPEQAVTDERGHIYVDIEDKDQVAVIDAKEMKMTATYGLNGKGGTPAGLAIDTRNHILFVACRTPQAMVMLDARDGKYLDSLPLGRGTDGAVFNPRTHEAFSSQGDGTLTVIKEKSPTSFEVEQTVTTMPGAKTLTLDTKSNSILLIAAEYLPGTTDPETGRQRRGQMIAGSFTILVVGR